MSASESSNGLAIIDLDDKLSKIRHHINSKLENQRHLAVILSAVEENIEEQKNEKSAAAYFVSFMSLLDQAIRNGQITDNSLATTTAYFLDLILPFLPKPLLKANFGDILTKLAAPLTLPNAEAPIVKSTIGALECLLIAQDHAQWASSSTAISPKRAFIGLLELSLDPRPKVRRRAQDAISKILMSPPASPSPVHVAAPVAGSVALAKLNSLLNEAKKTTRENNKEINSQIIHCIQLITAITSANAWPAPKIEDLCDVLLVISKTSDQYLVSSAFSAFEGFFKSMSNSIDVERFANVLNIIFDLKPSINDNHLAAAWLAVVAKALESFAVLAPNACIQKLPLVIPVVSSFLESDNKDIVTSASQCLIAIVVEAIPDDFLLSPTRDGPISQETFDLVDDTISFLALHIEKKLLTVTFQKSTKEILEFVQAVILKLSRRSNPDFLDVLLVVGAWRTDEVDSFPYNKEAEDVISACISTMGPEVVLGVLPLNLTGATGQPGRAWMLPLLRDNVRFASLGYFKSSIFPAVEYFEQKVAESTNKESLHTKIFETIVDQIWSLLPHFCDLPTDLRDAFDDSFAASLSNLMYSRVELRVPICHALRLLVESNKAYNEGAMDEDKLMIETFPKTEAAANLQYLATKAANILSVLFNVFSSTSPEARGFVAETIDVYLQVIPNSDLEVTFNKVCGMLKQAMDDERAAQSKTPNTKPQASKLSATLMDLIVSMAKYVPETSHNALFAIFSSTVSLKDDHLMQKRSYRIISRLAETLAGKKSILNFINEIQTVISETTETTHNSARPSRLNAIYLMLDILPASNLHFIPATLQEIIMSTKDVNERSRELSYQILIKMGSMMEAGGIIENKKVPGFAPDTPPSNATLTEYITMVSAGLAAQAPHMISATITALSCLVFEFKDRLPTDVLLEITSTVELFLTHNSREIAKAAIGFVKVEVLSLPEDFVRANLKQLLEKLMRWSHEHKGHFASKVKHILERLVRKFGYDLVEDAIPEEDKKLIANIKKLRARAQKKLAQAIENKSAPGEAKKFTSAYEEALYDSDVSDDEQDEENETASSKGKKNAKQFILNTGDEPLNLMDRQSLAQILSSRPKKFTKSDVKRGSDVSTKNGKLVFEDNADDDELLKITSGIDSYVEAVKQAPVRGQKNKLKFKKTEDEHWSDDENTGERNTAVRNKSKSKVTKPQKKRYQARKKL